MLLSLFLALPRNARAADYCSCTIGTVNSVCLEKTLCVNQGGKCGATCAPVAQKPTTNPGTATVNSNSSVSTKPGYLGGSGIAQYIPDCTKIQGQCSDVSVFLVTAVGIGQYVFGIIGVLALVMFVYGGLVWITANGNPEKVKQGMGIFMSAVIGLVIVFSAYMLVKYFGSSILNIGSEYQLQ